MRDSRSRLIAAVRGADLPSVGKPKYYANEETAKREMSSRITAAVDKVLGTTPRSEKRTATREHELWYGRDNPFPPGTYNYAFKKHVESWDSEAGYGKASECHDWPQ